MKYRCVSKLSDSPKSKSKEDKARNHFQIKPGGLTMRWRSSCFPTFNFGLERAKSGSHE